MANERITEDLVENELRRLGYYDEPERIFVEKQQSVIEPIRKALSKASKNTKAKTRKAGYPEFIITSPDTPDMVVIVECKAETKFHESTEQNKPKDFAVDGAIHYARFLTDRYTVIAIAVSGSASNNLTSIYVMTKGETHPRPLYSPQGAQITEIIPLDDLFKAAAFDPSVQAKREKDLISFSQVMHVFMRDEAELEEKEKPLAVAGSLLALHDEVFAKTYQAYSAKDLPDFWMQSIQKVVDSAEIPYGKVANMTQPFTGIQVHPELGKPTKGYPQGLLHEIVRMLAEKVLPFITYYHDFDVVGAFYGEFLKYTGGDGKGLGIVLTPKHITELFSLLANVNKNSVVVDICAGTGGFLISAMNQMLRNAVTEQEVEDIKKKRLIGVEQKPSMYALAASNMILRGDGKANLYQGSCMDDPIIRGVKEHKATVGLINPPYAKTKEDLHELKFVEQMLDCLQPNATGIAIVPISCATSDNEHKRNLLKKHTLEAVMSMPPELFYPVSTVTCIMVFTAKIPHAVSDRKTWFGYWREDGFVKVKNLGRIDRDGTWPEIRDHWVSTYRNREVHVGESVMQKVTADDEWVAEAYMETDYTHLNARDFEQKLLDYALFTLKGTGIDAEAIDEA